MLQIIQMLTVMLALTLTSFGPIAAQNASPSPGGAVPGPNATPPQAAELPADGSNVVQPVPGAMPGSDTVPSTISEKNAADDMLSITAYTFKNLTEDERHAIVDALRDKPEGKILNAGIGVVLPFGTDLQDIPDGVASQVPRTKGYRFMVANQRILLVSPTTRVVVAAMPRDQNTTTGEGRGSAKPDSESRP
jgi:hypothetical protein